MINLVFKTTMQPLITLNSKPLYIYNVLNAFKFMKRGIHLRDKAEDFTSCFATLQIPKDSDQEAVRQAFLKLVKRFHPDSGSPEASVEQFTLIEMAYRKLQNKFADERWNSNKCAGEYGLCYEENKESIKEYDIKHTAPQHRQYLSYDGYGVGTPSQRQRQHERKRAVTAMENVHDHHVNKLKQTHERGLAVRGGDAAKQIKTRFDVDRLVEDLIQESMARGEFDNLPGAGKPLPFDQHSNPYVDFVTHKMNQVLIDNGFTPEWITLQKEIREEIRDLRDRLSNARTRLGPMPVTEEECHDWSILVKKEEESVLRLNKKINHFNLLVPLLVKQMVLVSLEREGEKTLKEGKNKLQVPSHEGETKPKNVKRYNGADTGGKGLFGFLESLLSRS